MRKAAKIQRVDERKASPGAVGGAQADGRAADRPLGAMSDAADATVVPAALDARTHVEAMACPQTLRCPRSA